MVCPAELGKLPAPTKSLKPGDFVAIRLADHAGGFTEVVWATVQSIIRKRKSKLPGAVASAIRIRVTGTVGTSSVATPASEMHGFDIGTKMAIDRNCVWEVFHTSKRGMALCGLYGRKVSGQGTPAAAGAAVAGDEVLIYLAPVKDGTILVPGPGWDVPNPVWARIVRVSATQSVLRVKILDTPGAMPGMTLERGNVLDVSRDCIYEVRGAGG